MPPSFSRQSFVDAILSAAGMIISSTNPNSPPIEIMVDASDRSAAPTQPGTEATHRMMTDLLEE